MRAWLLGCGAAALLLAGWLWLPQPGDAQRRSHPAAGFVVRSAGVFDGERLLVDTDVLVKDGRVVAVGHGLAVAPGLPEIDGRGRTLLPGLIDAHVHTYGSGLSDALNFGVTTVLDMFTDPAVVRELKPAREALVPSQHADLFSAGWLATAPGGHGTEFGLPVPTLSTPAQAPAWVAARIAEGSDWIKIVYEPPGRDGERLPFASLDRATLGAVIEAAHRTRRLAVVHVTRREPARQALAAGADGLVHVYADEDSDDEVEQLAAARHAFVTPTLSVLRSFAGQSPGPGLAADPQIAPYLSPEQRSTLVPQSPRRLDPALARIFHADVPLLATARLNARGVDLLAGTDAPNPGTAQGVSLHGELELLVRAGLTPTQALAAATSVPARRFSLQDRGRIAPGSRADLVLVRGDPTTDIRATRSIIAIWKNGAPIQRRRYPSTSR